MLKFEFKDASPERKQEMLSEIISKYNVANRNEMIQALGHAQAVLGCSQEDFASHPAVNLSTRQVRVHKKEFLDVYESAVTKYTQSPELKDVESELEEDALEAVYQNLLARLQSPKTSTKDLATILEYFGISGAELRQYASLRNATMRGFLADNMQALVSDDDTAQLIKSVIAESAYLYLGTEKTLGNTVNAQNMDLNNPIVKLEVMTLGLLMIGLFNGRISESFNNHAETLRLLKLSAGSKTVNPKSFKEFEKMDGKQPPAKAISPEMEKELIALYGREEGTELFNKLSKVEDKVAKQTALKLPKYEDVAEQYQQHLKVYVELEDMPLKVLLAKLDAEQDKQYKAKYQEFIDLNKEEN
ncbi:hypothetical protein [Priestia megaterium]|uniref:hypothetical protein n=1 Tax=Priestia megaterium TaxID=1404 RepID=UPI00277F237F|nr:hypothetical protein [Priestia megaterium]MDQ0805455.1 hypothetical protein [Priestia megaterium]